MAAIATVWAGPGWGGTIGGGYCDTCGLAAVPAPPGPARATGPAYATGSAPYGGTGSSSTGSTGSRAGRRGSSRSSRGHLGAGLVEIPPVSAADPPPAALAHPLVP